MKLRHLPILVGMTFCTFVQSQITIETGYTAEELIRNVLLESSACDQTSNYAAFTGTDIGVNGIGAFEANGSEFPFERGIILSTGRAQDAPGGPDFLVSSGNGLWEGDDQLSTISGLDPLYNASYISFDFIPLSSSISFNFLFASEEYAETFQCEFSDVFAFILTSPNGETENLAVIPETNQPVSVTTIRPGFQDPDQSTLGCEPENPELFAGYNEVNDVISFLGNTINLKAETNVIPGENYNIKLVIADYRDASFDSAVFLEAGSFNFLNLDLGEDRIACNGQGTEIDATTIRATGYSWFKDGVELPEFKNQPKIIVDESYGSGNFAAEVSITETCTLSDSIAVEFSTEVLAAEMPINLTQCTLSNQLFATFSFEENTKRILGDLDKNIYQVTYFETEEDAKNFESPIENPNNYQAKAQDQTIYTRIASQQSCYQILSFQLSTTPMVFANELLQEKYYLCFDNSGNPQQPFPKIETYLSEKEHTFTWYRGQATAQNTINGETGASLTVNETGIYSLEVTFNEIGCAFLFQTEVIALPAPENVSLNFLSNIFSNNQDVEIIIQGSSEYMTSMDGSPLSDQRTYENLALGEHVAQIIDINGCHTITMPFVLVDYPRFFTPNNDGANDTWQIADSEQFDYLEISIFDQYGKLLTVLAQNDAWDGRIGNEFTHAGEYWFKMSYSLNNVVGEFKSHFSLKR